MIDVRRPAPGRLSLRRDEDGQVLVLVLAALILLGILAGALAGLAAPSFAHSAAVRSLNDTVSAADSGIEYGIQFIRDQPSQCVNQPVNVPLSLPMPPPLNGRTVQVTCRQLTPPGTSPSTSNLELDSTATATAGGNPVASRAIVQINNFTGYATVQSWRTCRGGC